MVQQVIDKIREYRLVSGATVMPAGDKQNPISIRKVALRELPNESANIMNKSPANSPLPKEKGHTPDSLKIVSPDSIRLIGIKRQKPEISLSPCSNQTPGKVGTNVNLVYVRRKLETEQGKAGGSVNINNAASPESRKVSDTGIKEPSMQHGQKQDPNTAAFQGHVPVEVVSLATSSGGLSVPHSAEKPFSAPVRPEAHDFATGTSAAGDPNRTDYKERFVRLQTFLKSCDQSSQEEYIQMLRSLSAVGRSRHAVELERRAIYLLLEEGKELHRMRVLNVLGKASPSHASVSAQASCLQAQFQR